MRPDGMGVGPTAGAYSKTKWQLLPIASRFHFERFVLPILVQCRLQYQLEGSPSVGIMVHSHTEVFFDIGGTLVWNHIRLLQLTLVFALAALGQTFSSGSTGVDGPLDLTSGDMIVQLPESGILNYTTINVPAGRTLMFKPNTLNTPVVLLAQGSVTVAGWIDVSATAGCYVVVGSTYCGTWNGDIAWFRIPGPGGFYGGAVDQSGFGPGGGAPNTPGQWIGPLSLVPPIGGSGAGGNISGPGDEKVVGGGGGGAIVIASSLQITISGEINANGGGGYTYWGSGSANSWGGGGGAIRLVSDAVTVAGHLVAMGGNQYGGPGGPGTIRIEAPNNSRVLTGSANPPAVLSEINPIVVPTDQPLLTIQSIGGYPVPSYSGSSFSTIDLLLPSQLQDPIPVVIRGTNIPVGSPVTIRFNGSVGATATTATLTGTTASSTATLYVSGLTRSAVTYLFVMATFDPTLVAGNLRQSGPNAVSRVEVASALGENTTYRFLRRDGTEVNLPSVPAELRRALGL